jgi:hypothetical protein
MKQYMLSVYHPEIGSDRPPPENLDEIMRDVDAVNQELRAAGAWVFAGGLHPSSTATVVRLKDGEILSTDGPFVEGKEHVAGLWVTAGLSFEAPPGRAAPQSEPGTREWPSGPTRARHRGPARRSPRARRRVPSPRRTDRLSRGSRRP